MNTIIIDKDGQELNFLTQQYQVGMYLIINNDPSEQYGLDTQEKEFHTDLRLKAIKNGDTIIGGSYIAYKNNNIDINPFVNGQEMQ